MFFKHLIQDKLDEKIKNITPLAGGDINDVYKIITSQNVYVLKTNQVHQFPDMLAKEKIGLEILTQTGVISPKVIFTFSDQNHQYLLLEFIYQGKRTQKFWKNFAFDLVTIHQTKNEVFGLEFDNYIGSLKQINKQNKSWESFFITHRLSPLIKQAFDNKMLNDKHLKSFDNLFNRLNEILIKENPALLHGDLWAGNLMSNIDQKPVFIDPAVYFGHREMDIAMTKMFGGFDYKYIDYYNEIFPLEKNWKDRIEIHNLYPNLVHLNLFGLSYLKGIEYVLRKFK